MKTTPPIDPARTALVLIDLQKGIVPHAAAPRTGAEVVAHAARLAKAFREAQATVVLVHVAFSADGGDRLRAEVDSPAKMPPSLPPDWAEFVPELDARPSDLRILKRQWGAFYGTELDLQLRRRGVTKIVLGGVSTNIGVESTARAAYEHGYEIVIAEETTATNLSEEAHRFAVETIFPRLALVRSTDEILAALKK